MSAVDSGVIATERLILEPWSASLADHYVKLMANSEVVRFGYGHPRTPGQAVTQLGTMILEWETNGFGSYAIRDQATGTVGGYVGVHAPWTFPDLLPIMEVGVRVIPEWWGTGRAIEAISPMMDIGFDVLNAAGLAGIFLPCNEGARSINARLGMSFHSKRMHPTERMTLEIDVASRESWREARLSNERRFHA